jgi:hypothetical protein
VILKKIGNKLWNSRSDLNTKKIFFGIPKTIQEYYNVFPDFLASLFLGIINKLREKKIEIANRQRKKSQKPLITITNHETTTKIIIFITSILIGLAFPSFKVWLSQVVNHNYLIHFANY